jgi:hypothetical protein
MIDNQKPRRQLFACLRGFFIASMQMGACRVGSSCQLAGWRASPPENPQRGRLLLKPNAGPDIYHVPLATFTGSLSLRCRKFWNRSSEQSGVTLADLLPYGGFYWSHREVQRCFTSCKSGMKWQSYLNVRRRQTIRASSRALASLPWDSSNWPMAACTPPRREGAWEALFGGFIVPATADHRQAVARIKP